MHRHLLRRASLQQVVIAGLILCVFYALYTDSPAVKIWSQFEDSADKYGSLADNMWSYAKNHALGNSAYTEKHLIQSSHASPHNASKPCKIPEAYASFIHDDHEDIIRAAILLAYSVKGRAPARSTRRFPAMTVQRRPVILMVTPQTSNFARERLAKYFDLVVEVPSVPHTDYRCRSWFKEALFRYGNNEVSTPYGKIAAWGLESVEISGSRTKDGIDIKLAKLSSNGLSQTLDDDTTIISFGKVVYLDITTHVSYPLGELFRLPGAPYPSATFSIFPSDRFNTRLMVIEPSKEVYNQLLTATQTKGDSPDCTESSFINNFFSDWLASASPEYRISPRFYQESFGKYGYRPVRRGYKLFESSGLLHSLSYMDHSPRFRKETWPWTTVDPLERHMEELSQDAETWKNNAKIELVCARSKKKLNERPAKEEQTRPKVFRDYTRKAWAYVTFIQNQNEDFIRSAEVMLHTLKHHSRPIGSDNFAWESKDHIYPLDLDVVAMVTPFVGPLTRLRLQLAGFVLREVNGLAHPMPKECGHTKWVADQKNMENSEVGKMRVWELTEYEKIVYVDADTIILGPIVDMFEHPGHPISVSHGMFPPFQFNAGIMVLTPSKAVLQDMLDNFRRLGTSDCGDQGFLNNYFDFLRLPADHHLPAKYNTNVRTFTMQNVTRSKEFFEWISPRILHFSGGSKPWSAKLKFNGTIDFGQVWWSHFLDAHAKIGQKMFQNRRELVETILDRNPKSRETSADQRDVLKMLATTVKQPPLRMSKTITIVVDESVRQNSGNFSDSGEQTRIQFLCNLASTGTAPHHLTFDELRFLVGTTIASGLRRRKFSVNVVAMRNVAEGSGIDVEQPARSTAVFVLLASNTDLWASMMLMLQFQRPTLFVLSSPLLIQVGDDSDSAVMEIINSEESRHAGIFTEDNIVSALEKVASVFHLVYA